MTDTAYAEAIRHRIAELAQPIRPGEMVGVWLDRVARATGLPASRLRSYWHRKVARPRLSEYLAVMAAAEAAARRHAAIAQLEDEIGARARRLERDHARLHPLLARLAPAPPPARPAETAPAPAIFVTPPD